MHQSQERVFMKAKILIVSHDIDMISAITRTLEKVGHRVVLCDIPIRAAAKCQEEKCDLVFIDVNIRETPYDEVVEDIKQTYSGTEIILVTTYAFPESMAKGQVLDISGYLIKPLNEAKIRNVTARALRQGELALENRRLLLAVTAAKKEWEAIVDAIDDPLFVTDFDYTILRANLATFQHLGKGVNEVIGKKCYSIFHCADHALEECPGKKARDTGEPVSETIHFRGLKQKYHCSVYPQIFSGGGGLVHYLQELVVDAEQQAATLTKYERLFDDARIPIILIHAEDYMIIDANQKAVELFGYDPQTLFNTDLEDLFVESLRETAINNIIQQAQSSEAPLKIKIIDHTNKQIDVFIVANPTNIGNTSYIELFIIPLDLLSRSRLDNADQDTASEA
jgi:PAS domain S-box-containing protein